MGTAEQAPPIRDAGEFLAWEERQDGRYEFFDGVVRMMVGAKGIHNTLCANVRNALHARRPKGCRVYSEGFKLLVWNNVFYPDAFLTCDPEAPHKTATTQALVTAEVLSPSTARIDQFRKKAAYLSLPGLRYYLIISPEVCQIEVYTRHEDGPPTVELYDRLDQVIALPGLDAAIPVAEIYLDTDVREDVIEGEA